MPARSQQLQEAVRLHRAGRFAEADRIYQGILRVDPSHADAWHLAGLCAVQQGNAAAALPSLRRAVELHPASAVFHTSLGTALKNCGDHDGACEHFQTALAIQPASMEARFNLANLYLARQEYAAAAGQYREANRLRPENADVLNNLGTALKHLDRGDEAERCYREALDSQPEHAGALRNLAALLHAQSRCPEAAGLYAAVIRLEPDNFELRNNFAACLHDCGRFAEAESELRRILHDRPDFAAAWITLGCLCNDLSRPGEAARCFQQALAVDPESAAARNNLGNSLKALGRFDEAADEYSRAIQSRPEFLEAISNLAGVRQSQGRTDEARELLRHVRRRCVAPFRGAKGDILREFEEAVLLPPVYRSLPHLEECRQRLEGAVAELRQRGVVIDAATRAAPTLFYAAYHGRNDRELMESTAALFESSFDFRQFRRERPRGDRLRIGFLSAFLREHTIWRLLRGIVENLSRDRFEVVLLTPAALDACAAAHHSGTAATAPGVAGSGAKRNPGEPLHRGFPAVQPRPPGTSPDATEVVEITRRLNVALERTAAADLDVLVYPDVGMDPLTTTMARTRLAPLQCVMWGHPVTTGMPAMDCFLSSRLLETDAAADHYSERLVLLDRLPCCYEPPGAVSPAARGDFGLPAGRPLYLCPQSLFKFHPDFDDVPAGIFDRDPRGLLVLLDPPHETWKQTLQQRWAVAPGPHVDRIHWIPRMARERFLQLLSLADVMLDPPHFGGGNTNYEALALGVPVVTLPSEFLRGRIALGLYRTMGIVGCVADSIDDYVSKAVAIANDVELRREIVAAIRQSSPPVFDDVAAVRELEEFWAGAANR
jgi:protein O-GlcNAc transferase